MDARTVAAALLFAVPFAGWLAAGHPSLIPVWSAERERRLAIVARHRLAWRFLNAGFVLATLSTASGLAVLAAALTDRGTAPLVAAAAVVYAIAGALWCVVLAIRTRTWPLFGDRIAAGQSTEPAESLEAAAVGGLFEAFALVTATALVLLGLALLLGGGVVGPIALLTAFAGAILFVAHVVTGDSVPVLFYLPTQLIGLALLMGWT